MRKTMIAGLVGLVVGAGVLLTGPVQAAYNGNDCTGYGTEVADSGVHVAALGNGETSATLAGICVDTGVAAAPGGVLEVGGAVGNQQNRLCGSVIGNTTVTTPAGVYGVIDGHAGNSGAAKGYGSLGNYEGDNTTESGNATSCEGNDDDGNNSGGSVGVSEVGGVPVGVYAPIPLIGCANDTGGTYNTSGRDGCFIDTTN